MKQALPRWFLVLALLAGIIWAGGLAGMHLSGSASIIDRFETVLLDVRIKLAGHRRPPEDVVIVAIDDRTVDWSGNYPLPRDKMAALVGRIAEQGARALAVDILLSEGSDSGDDLSLARSFGTLPSVIAQAGYHDDVQPSAGFVPFVSSLLSPAPVLMETASIGIANIVQDTAGTPRHIPLLFLTPDGLKPALSLQATGLYLGENPVVSETGLRFDGRAQSLDLGWHLPLNYYGPGRTIRTVSALDLLDPGAGEGVDLKGRMVVLGVTATAIGERFSTPFDPVMPGVEVQATGIANLLDGSPLVRKTTTRIIDGAAALVITLLGLVAVFRLPPAPASLVFLLLLCGWLAVTAVFFHQGLWLNGALPIAASLPPFTGLMIARQFSERSRARRLLQAQQALGRFQSPQLARHIAEDPQFLTVPREQKAAILFIDLSGFTSLSEELSAAETREFLKQFHTVVVDTVTAEDGVVLDFMGDGALVCFGVPHTDRTDPLRAYRCAFRLEQATRAWLEASGLTDRIGRVRVGAHFGPVVLSRLGHDSQQQISATGDCVNVASRLLEIAKEHNATIVLSSDLIDAVDEVTENPACVPQLETVAIRGRKGTVRVGLWRTGETGTSFEPLQQKQKGSETERV